MGSHNFLEPLESVINVILTVIEPHQADWNTRFQVIEALRNVVVSVESLRGATVEEYGSFVSNLFTKWGDLDISIQLANGLYISDSGKRRKVTLLGDLQKALRQKDVCHKLQFISHARVPILKFESKFSSISCDISIDNLPGRMKSKFFLWLNKIDERFRKMVLLVKEWAKSHGINDPKSGSFNSFSLTLLVIFHFQTCVPSILPPLRDIYPRNMIDDLKGERADAEQHITQVCFENISSFRSNRSKPVNRSSMAELFISFLAKFAQLDSKAGDLGICPYSGQWEERDRNKRWMPKTRALFIEDPFEQPENSARTVSTRQLARISEVFETTHQWFLSSNQHELGLLGPFARSQLSQYVIRSPVTNPSYGAVPFAPSQPSQYVTRSPVTNPSYGAVPFAPSQPSQYVTRSPVTNPSYGAVPFAPSQPSQYVTRSPVTNPSYGAVPFAPSQPSQYVTRSPVTNPSSGAVPFAPSQYVIHSPVTNPSYGSVPFAQQMQRAIRYAPAQTHRPNQTFGMAQPHGNTHYSTSRPQWDIQAGVLQRPNTVHATSWRARPEGANGPSKNVRPQPNATNHLPQALQYQNKQQQVWKPRFVKEGTS